MLSVTGIIEFAEQWTSGTSKKSWTDKFDTTKRSPRWFVKRLWNGSTDIAQRYDRPMSGLGKAYVRQALMQE
jgi:hypothetical protein